MTGLEDLEALAEEMEMKTKVDFSDVKKVIDKITEEHYEKIKDNESFEQLLNKIAEENDKKNALIEEIVEATGLLHKQIQNCNEYSRLNSTRISALEIAVAHIEKGNEQYIKWNDNLQSQIDILAEDIQDKQNQINALVMDIGEIK